MSSQSSFVTFLFLVLGCRSVMASALPWPAEEEQQYHAKRIWAGHAPRSTTSASNTGMPGWEIACIALGLFFGVMGLGMIGGALEVLLHTRKKVADPDPADLDFGPRGADAEAAEAGEKGVQGEGEEEEEEADDTDDDGATAVDGEGSAHGGNDEKAKQLGRFSWQDEQGVQMEVWNDDRNADSRDMNQEAWQHAENGTHEDMSADCLPQHPEPAHAGTQHATDQEDEVYYPQSYQHEDMYAYAEGNEAQREAHHDHGHDEVQDVQGQRTTRYEPWVPQMGEDFHEVPLPEHGAQSETTHQQHPVEYI